MGLTNCKPKIAVVYASVTGNTTALGRMIIGCFREAATVSLFRINEFPIDELSGYDAVIVGTYTWGSGDIPKEMHRLYEAFESQDRKNLVTAVFGTGDSFYPNYCGAVDRFRDMFYVRTDLAVTLKVELMPQEQDRIRCQKFTELVLNRLGVLAS